MSSYTDEIKPYVNRVTSSTESVEKNKLSSVGVKTAGGNSRLDIERQINRDCDEMKRSHNAEVDKMKYKLRSMNSGETDREKFGIWYNHTASPMTNALKPLMSEILQNWEGTAMQILLHFMLANNYISTYLDARGNTVLTFNRRYFN